MTREGPLSVAGGGVAVILCDLLMAAMNSIAVWTQAAADAQIGLAWRDATAERMRQSAIYVPYEGLVADAADALQIPADATSRLFEVWSQMQPWPDTVALARQTVSVAFLSNCSDRLARLAAQRSGMGTRIVMSAEEVGWYKPDRRAYLEACARLGTTPAETLFIAGSAYDADGAHAAGLKSVLVRRRSEEQPGADIPVVDSLESLGVVGFEAAAPTINKRGGRP